MAQLLRAFRPHRFEWVLFRAESLPEADLRDLRIECIGPRERPTSRQREDLKQHVSWLARLYLMRWVRRGAGWIFIGYQDDAPAHVTFVRLPSVYRKLFPAMCEPAGVFIGPCVTGAEFRGRRIYPRVLRYAVGMLTAQGFGPAYIHTHPNNIASIKGIERAGFSRCGIWSGTRTFGYLFVTSKRTGD